MTDVHNAEQRSFNMSRVRSKNTGPEVRLRKALFARGLRYRLHVSELPGKPDMVFPRYKAVVFVHGCFWHVHDCPRFSWPATNQDFWKTKLERNQTNDQSHLDQLQRQGWRVMVVWECSLVGKGKYPLEQVADAVVSWLRGSESSGQILSRHCL